MSGGSEEASGAAWAVRRMTESDLGAVAKLEQQCFSDAWSMRLLADSFKSGYDYFFVAEGPGGVCGYADIRIVAGESEIERIAVASGCRRRGIGRKLMEAVTAFASREGAGDMTLEVRQSNTAARKLYSSFGFAEEGRRRDYYRNPSEDALIMWRREA